MLKKILLKVLPNKLIRYLYGYCVLPITLMWSFLCDFIKYYKHSDSFLLKKQNELLGNIIKHYHVIEKGLAMPEMRLGFGQGKLRMLITECNCFINRFGKDNQQVLHALNVIHEYSNLHTQKGYVLDPLTTKCLLLIDESMSEITGNAMPVELTKTQYFEKAKESFDLFSISRASVRDYSSEEVPLSRISDALELAKNTPSACNRQPWRTKVYSDNAKMKKILSMQGGNRGFGHLADKLIVVTVELGGYAHAFERNLGYVDGGIYVMNLLYALHFNEIATCTLNCCFPRKKERLLQAECGVKDSEVFIAMIACGVPSEKFKIPKSPRYDIGVTNQMM